MSKLEQLQYVIEGIILRRLHEKRIEGYTIETAKEMAEAVAALQSSADSAAALRLLAAEDERQSRLHELLETIREQIRLEVAPEHRPEGLFKNIQDAVYAMRGRTRLMDDAAITHVLNVPQTAPSDALAELEQQFIHVLDGWEEDSPSPAAISALQYALGAVRDAAHRSHSQAGSVPQAAIENLTNHQVRCDQDGVMIQVSRQALDEVLAYVALSRPQRPKSDEPQS